MATIKIPSYVQLGSGLSGQVANVNYEVFDANGVSVLTRTSTGVSERLDFGGNGTGSYKVTINADLSWVFPLSVEWTMDGADGEGVFASSVVGWEFALMRNKGLILDLSQPITDGRLTTVGGALAGLWALAWGKVAKDLTLKTLSVFGPGNNSSTPTGAFQLDDVVNPTQRVPIP
jgi:hypothetical protein